MARLLANGSVAIAADGDGLMAVAADDEVVVSPRPDPLRADGDLVAHDAKLLGVDAADTQARALGFPAARVFVPHPIQDRTDDEMRAYADAAFEEVVASVSL